MEKTIKSLCSLFVAAVMVLCMVPSAMAAITEGIEIETVALVGSGAGFSGTDLKATMNDNWFLNQFDRKVLEYNSTASGLEANVSKMVKLTEIGDGLEFTLAEKATVKRLDLWIMSLGGIKDYRVLASDDGTNYDITVADATFPLYNGTTEATDANAVSSYYPIVFDAPVEAKSIKFVVDSFVNDDESVAYISEAKLYNTNEIDLGQNTDLQNVKLSSSSYLYGYSPYVSDYTAWGLRSGISNTISSSSENRYSSDGQMWPYGDNNGTLYYPSKSSSSTYLWWGTTFGNSKVKINKIGLDLEHRSEWSSSAKGVVTGFEVYVTDNHDNIIGTKIGDPTGENEVKESWTKIATISCNLTDGSDDILFELPEAKEAAAIFVKVTAFTETPMLRGVKMYSVANYELTSRLENEKLDGTAAPGETLTFSIDSENNNCPNAKVFFALYSNEILQNITVEPLVLSAVDNRTYSVNYTIPEDASGTLSVRAFYLDSVTLVPLINNPPTVSAD